MNRTHLRAASATLLAAAGLAALGTADTSASAAAHSHALTFTVRTLASSQVGDRHLIETDTATKDGHTIGYTANSCTFDFAAGVAHCLVTLARPQGQLRVAVTVHPDSGDVEGRVTGGTGAYRGARGAVSGGAGPQKGTQLITLRWQD
jgi:hypothetical protein